ncbi:MAG TPA: sialidase family protein [Parasegetibacter sp.]
MSVLDKRNNQFSDRIKIPIEQNVNLHEEGMPKLAFKSDGTIIAIYEIQLKSEINKFASGIRYIVSKNKGISWTEPAFLHSDTSHDNSHSFAAATRLADGEIGVAWLDQSFNPLAGGRPVMFAKTDRNNIFHNEQVVDSIACECCRIALSSKGERVAIAFRDIINESVRDIAISCSNDTGKTFTPAVSFSNDNWAIEGCPHNGPSLALSGNATYAAWFTGSLNPGVYYGELNEKQEIIHKELLSSKGRFVQICLLNDGSRVLVYNELNQGKGKLKLTKIQKRKSFVTDLNLKESSVSYPVITSFNDNKLAIAWTSEEKVYYSVVDASKIK